MNKENINRNKNVDRKETECDKLVKLGQAEKMLKKVMSPVPSRPTLILYIKNGILKGKKFPFNNHYYVFESSLREFMDKYGSNLRKFEVND